MTVNPAGSFGHVPGGGGGGGTVTVIAAVPLWPSLVAVIVAAPTATPLTNPLPFTVATPPLPVAQLTARPANGAPVESCGVALSCTVCPTSTLAAGGLTTTAATGTALTTTTAESVSAAEALIEGCEVVAMPATGGEVLGA